MSKEICEVLKWDTEFFDLRVAHVMTNVLNEDQFETINTWCQAQDIDVLYFLATAHDPQTVFLAERNGFHFMDIRLTLEWSVDNNLQSTLAADQGITIRKAVHKDLPIIESIARNSYYDSRFYYDPGFKKEQCDALYAAWIKRSFDEYADIILVAEIAGNPTGYITGVLNEKARQGKIGLVGVSSNARGQGIGQQLVCHLLQWFEKRNVKVVKVVTQGRNVSAQRLYQRCDFLTTSVQLWYHKWFERKENRL